MCSPTSPPPLRPPLGAALRPRKSGSAAGWGTRLQSRARDSPTAPGQVPGGRRPPRGGRPACTPFRRRRRDRALQGSTPGSRFPAERSRSSAFRRDRWGRPENRGGGGHARIGEAPAPRRRGMGLPAAAAGLPTAARALALRPELRGRSSAPAGPRGAPRAALPRARLRRGQSGACQGQRNFANQAFSEARASSRSAPSFPAARTHGPPPAALPRNASHRREAPRSRWGGLGGGEKAPFPLSLGAAPRGPVSRREGKSPSHFQAKP